jgi:hypothetical protein
MVEGGYTMFYDMVSIGTGGILGEGGMKLFATIVAAD